MWEKEFYEDIYPMEIRISPDDRFVAVKDGVSLSFYNPELR